jgi:hypothetical protein
MPSMLPLIAILLLSPQGAPPSHEEMRRDAYRLIEILNPDSRLVLQGGETGGELAWPIALQLGRHPVGKGWWAPRVLGEFLIDTESERPGVFLGAGGIVSRLDGLAFSGELGWHMVDATHRATIGAGPGWSWPDLGQLRVFYRVGAGQGPVRHMLGLDLELFFDLID